MPKACPYVMMQFALSDRFLKIGFSLKASGFFMFLFFPQYLFIDPYFCAVFLYSVGVMPVWALKCL